MVDSPWCKKIKSLTRQFGRPVQVPLRTLRFVELLSEELGCEAAITGATVKKWRTESEDPRTVKLGLLIAICLSTGLTPQDFQWPQTVINKVAINLSDEALADLKPTNDQIEALKHLLQDSDRRGELWKLADNSVIVVPAFDKEDVPEPDVGSATRRIMSAICSGQLQQGDEFEQNWLAAQLGLAPRDTINALAQLVEEGVIRFCSGKLAGWYQVRKVASDEWDEILSLRELIEPWAAVKLFSLDTDDRKSIIDSLQWIVDEMQSAANVDDEVGFVFLDIEFHRILVSASRVATESLDSLLNRIRLGVVSTDKKRRMKEVISEHRMIVTSLRANGDAENNVRSAVEQHLGRARQQPTDK